MILVSCSEKSPESIILFIGSGMGVGHISADYYNNQKSPFVEFPVSALMRTDPGGGQWITDAAAAGTALATGIKVKRGAVSINEKGENIPTVFEIAKKRKMATGVIATTSITYATPAAFMVHTPIWGREFDIANQIASSGVDVLLGGGRRFFEWNTVADTNLMKIMEDDKYTVIYQQNQLAVLESDKCDKLLGLFAAEALKKANLRSLSLKLMTQKAVDVLDNNDRGFVLVVEGSQIDWRCHERDEDGLLAEMRDFTDAIRWAFEYQKNHREVLIIVAGINETGGVFLTHDPNGKGETRLKFVTGNHTANFCPVFAKGPGAEKIHGLMDISELGSMLIHILER
ncbi:MAG TPA: hypothetical protein DHW42_02190 [Candidatus Marinimicrobia bacterium]|nr:hypothetical protein [Candidatus Neomarinimicrobiota bacterium]